MAVRNDVTIDWRVSPRIIEVASPSTEITVQDLVDTLRDAEDDLENMSYDQIISAAGKEELGGGVLVGITATLLNALLQFEARPGPTYTQCTVSGGNLVAVDDVGVTQTTPINPTAFTQVVVTASSSATLQEQSAIQYSSYGGGVWLDTSTAYTGTEFPKGTPQEPVNNIDDALTIAQDNGFITIFLLSDYNFSGSQNLTGLNFVGEGRERTEITIGTGVTISDVGFSNLRVASGILDGESTIRDCEINNLDYVSGVIERCILEGTITLGNNAIAHILDSWSGVAGTGTPTIDMGGSGQALTLRNYNGGIKLTNKSGSESVSIDMASGQVKFGADVTNGTIVCRGVGEITEDLSSGATIVNNMLNAENIWKEDISAVTSGAGKDLTDAKKEATLAKSLSA